MRTADVVVIGGGCVGTSAIYHLARLGCTATVLLERAALGAGSTSKAAGGIRLQHESELDTRLVLRSLAEFTRFEELTGTPIDFKQVGYLFLHDDDRHLARFVRAAAVQRGLGIPTKVLGAGDAQAMVPGLTTDDLVGATYCPLEGYAAPEAVVQGYASAARRQGATVSVGTPVAEIFADGSGVAGVRTAKGDISTRQVVLAAGVDSGHLARPLGVHLPVHGEMRTVFFSSQSADVPGGAPLVVDYSSKFYFHREGVGLIFAGQQNDLADLSESAVHRLPAIVDISIESSWGGYYDMSPDHDAMIGRAPVTGLSYATGFSGHGFMQSPAAGEHLAELALGHEPTLNLSSMSAERFVEERPPAESFGV